MTISNIVECSGIISSTDKRRRWTALEKQQMVQEERH